MPKPEVSQTEIRWTLFVATAIYVIYFFSLYLPGPPTDSALREMLELNGHGSAIELGTVMAFASASFLARIVAAIGIWFGYRWGAVLLSVEIAANLIFTMFLGLAVLTALDMFFWTASTLAEGVLCAIAYVFCKKPTGRVSSVLTER